MATAIFFSSVKRNDCDGSLDSRKQYGGRHTIHTIMVAFGKTNLICKTNRANHQVRKYFGCIIVLAAIDSRCGKRTSGFYHREFE